MLFSEVLVGFGGKVIAHVGAVRTEDSVALARHAADCGADWVA